MRSEKEIWAKIINDARWYDGTPERLSRMIDHFKKNGFIIKESQQCSDNDLNALLIDIRKILEKNRREHYYCEDNLYSCPLEPTEGCSDPEKEHKCDCGADEYNAELDMILQELKKYFA